MDEPAVKWSSKRKGTYTGNTLEKLTEVPCVSSKGKKGQNRGQPGYGIHNGRTEKIKGTLWEVELQGKQGVPYGNPQCKNRETKEFPVGIHSRITGETRLTLWYPQWKNRENKGHPVGINRRIAVETRRTREPGKINLKGTLLE